MYVLFTQKLLIATNVSTKTVRIVNSAVGYEYSITKFRSLNIHEVQGLHAIASDKHNTS